MRAVLDPIFDDANGIDDLAVFPGPASARRRPRISIPPQAATRATRNRAPLLTLAAVVALAAACAVGAFAKGRGLKTRLLRLILPAAQPTLVRPSLINSRPCDGAAQVLPDAPIVAKLFLPNGAIDAATLNGSSVRLTRDADAAAVATELSPAGEHSVAIRPIRPLEHIPRYRV
jgi:hypothetical protein